MKLNKIITTIIIFVLGILFSEDVTSASSKKTTWWQIQSIDTMKYSRDLAREKLSDASFNQIIENQVQKIAQTGATHVALGTPYDDEFIPFLKKWVDAARKNGLNVWFRGNLSGWEGWFGYQKIDQKQHTQLTKSFIKSNINLFGDGDIFDPCVECENGGPGDPRITHNTENYRKFLSSEYQEIYQIFNQNGKDITIVYSMNGDVAKLIMDRQTTLELGGIVTIDHYLKNPGSYSQDLKSILDNSGGKILFGEIGAPVPDIHGFLTESQQAQWIDKAFQNLSEAENIMGINYWVGFGGTTRIWETNGKARGTLITLEKYFKPNIFKGRVINELGKSIKNVSLTTKYRSISTDDKGYFSLPFIEEEKLEINSKGYKEKTLTITQNTNQDFEIILKKEKENIFFSFAKIIYYLFNK